MADRYWVGGTAAWDTTAGTKWALTSGTAGGQAVPTSADDVFFDAASGAVTCTLSAVGQCKSITFTGFTGTFAGTSSLIVAGSVTFVSGMTLTHSGQLEITATGTLTTGGKTILATILMQTTGAVVTLGDALTCSTSITVNGGTFNTGNFNVTATQIISVSGTRTLNFGSSTITLTSGAVAFNLAGSLAGLTINAGTSTINVTNVSQISTSGQMTPRFTLYNVNFTDTTGGTSNISGGWTFNNLSVAGPASVGVTQITLTGITVNGTLSTTSTAGNRRVWFRGVTYGIAQTLTINSAPSLTDADFRDIYVIGTSAPISGTRIGNLRGCSGITFNAAKTVYWVTLAGGNWSGTNWSNESGGTASNIYFPLAQDTAKIVDTGLNTSAIVTFDAPVPYTGTVDMSGRTTAMTLNFSAANPTVYGDWINGSGTTLSTFAQLVFSGRNTQSITSAGKSFGQSITIDSFGGAVQLMDALNVGPQSIFPTTGTFNTNNFTVTAGALTSNPPNVRAINLGSSTVTLSSSSTPMAIAVSTTTPSLTFNAGTSQINLTSLSNFSTSATFYNVSCTGTSATTISFTGINTFNNLTIAASSAAGIKTVALYANQTITGTLTVDGASAVRRIFLQSNTVGTLRTLTVGTLAATDCDFRDITIAGAASGTAPTRAGNCGNNSGITFPTAKTVYWNLAGTQNWSATGWCTASGGTPADNNFPLPQDTAVFNNAGSITTVSVDAMWNIGTLDASARTGAMTLSSSLADTSIYGDLKLGSGVTTTGSGTLAFFKFGTQTITCNGASLNLLLGPASPNTVLQLADAFTSSNGIAIGNGGTFDSANFNVTISTFTIVNVSSVLKMGTSTWTITSAQLWSWDTSITSSTIFAGQSNIVFSNNSTTARGFVAASGQYYNKITIGGSAISTFVIQGALVLGELASTKTTAHTITLYSSTTYNIGKWSVTGTVGNVVTVQPGTAATVYTLNIIGPATTGIDYLSISYCAVSTSSPGEFYVGANSTNVLGNSGPIIFTATPSPSTRYWRGGTGTWNATNTTSWASASGGAGPASVPTSVDTVIFDSASNATAYTVTVSTAAARCGTLTIAGPAAGNLTINSSSSIPLIAHGDVTFAATGVVSSNMSGGIVLSGSTTGRLFTTNGVALTANTDVIQINGVGCGWTLGSATNLGSNAGLNVVNGSFSTANFSLTAAYMFATGSNKTSITLGSSTLTLAGYSSAINFGTTPSATANLTFNAGTSQININVVGASISGNGNTFYNVAFTGTSVTNHTVRGANVFNNFSIAGITSVGVKSISFVANQTINGTLTILAGTDATMRNFVQSDILGTTRTLTCAAFAGTDADFRDITIAGAAAPVSGTRLGDCKGNSGITFGAGVIRYWNLAGGGNWSSTGWAATSGSAPAANNFPLAQDTALFESTGLNSGATVTIDAAFNIGTIDMSARTSNTMTLADAQTHGVYGNWVNGTGTTLSGAGTLTFAGRGSQTITSAGKTFTQGFTISTPGGSVTLQDNFVSSNNTTGALVLAYGTFNANIYNVTFTGTTTQLNYASTSNVRTMAVGSGTWTIPGENGGAWNAGSAPTNLTITGTGTITLTGATAKSFLGGGLSYSGITLNQGGAGTLTISGNNTFANISNTYKATGATNITLGTTTQTVGSFTASGEVGRVLTVQGSSASSPGTLIYTGAGNATLGTTDYLDITGIRAHPLTAWQAGENSTNNGSLGFTFTVTVSLIKKLYSGGSNTLSVYYGSKLVNSIYYGSVKIFG